MGDPLSGIAGCPTRYQRLDVLAKLRVHIGVLSVMRARGRGGDGRGHGIYVDGFFAIFLRDAIVADDQELGSFVR
jgi:hypothetical protein